MTISNYSPDDLDFRAEAAMDWPERITSAAKKPVSYRANRLFIMLDGPLAFHSVLPGSARTKEPAVEPRRRIMRCHAKVHHHPFYSEHSRRLGSPEFNAENFSRVMGASGGLTDADLLFRKTVIRDFYRERVSAYAEGWRDYQSSESHVASSDFFSQLRKRVP